MNKFYVVSAVDCGDSCSGHSTCLGVFHSKEEARNYVRNDMEDRCDEWSNVSLEVDFDRMEISNGDEPICLWTIDEVENNISNDKIEKAKKILIDNGIEQDEAETVLQALGYVLLDAELFPNITK